jgi:gluconolactonase
VILAQQGGRKPVCIDLQFKEQPFLDTLEGKKFNSPNDLVFARDASLRTGAMVNGRYRDQPG